MNIASIILAIFALLSVFSILALGIFSMAKGGAFNKKHGNKLMKLRVLLQGLALLLFALAYWASQIN